ncbi:MAG: hypothetical protein HC884_05720 [Chloroflexaceae bacterium]|nr:hypothetical protein [Chloroflexaceae bacterium]
MTVTGISYDEALEVVQQLSATDQLKLTMDLIRRAPWTLEPAQPIGLSFEERSAHTRALQGKYAHILTPSDEFARQKQEDIDLEDSMI